MEKEKKESIQILKEETKHLTEERVKNLGTTLASHAKKYLPKTNQAEKDAPVPPQLVGTHANALKYLRIIPILLGCLFCFSFFWDTNAFTFHLFGWEFILEEGLIRIVSVSGLIGYLTNWLAITMLFQPRKPRPIFGQGLVPAQKQRVVYRLAQAVSTELINAEIIKQKIHDSQIIGKYRALGLDVLRQMVSDEAFRTDIKAIATSYIQDVIGSENIQEQIKQLIIQKLEEISSKGIGGVALKTYRFFNEDDFQKRVELAIREIPAQIQPTIEKLDPFLMEIPSRIEAHADDIEDWVTNLILGFVNNIDIYSMVFENLNKYDEQKLEGLIKGSTNEQLNYIKYLGGILGLLGGLVIWNPMLALAFFAILGGILWSIDEILYRLKLN